jgi:hypothetical protein
MKGYKPSPRDTDKKFGVRGMIKKLIKKIQIIKKNHAPKKNIDIKILII